MTLIVFRGETYSDALKRHIKNRDIKSTGRVIAVDDIEYFKEKWEEGKI